MSNQTTAAKQTEIDFELIPIVEESSAREEAAASRENECWISRDA